MATHELPSGNPETANESKIDAVVKDVILKTRVEGWNDRARTILGLGLAGYFTELQDEFGESLRGVNPSRISEDLRVAKDSAGGKDLLKDFKDLIVKTGIERKRIDVIPTANVVLVMLQKGLSTYEEYRLNVQKNISIGGRRRRSGTFI